ncbi:MAG TPA: TetR/AcrR family transcriptional regulator [Myxococcota bacterium]|nr:TetR/AcrR family transcriptional regulator [Myxococcota bacterium]HRY95300.1 TetR/AcrR family transcriptional regulator [Myxococcota bacterium]HSA20875.1 TetR/AcrR family transcriptional regulator [Myxococcota bacterium]
MPRLKAPDQQDVQHRIRAEAIQLFCAKGYVATSVNDIVRAAGVTKPVLYYYFGSKAGLFDALLGDAFLSLQRLTQEAAEHPGGLRARLLDLVERNFAFCNQHPEQLRFILYALFAPEQGIPEVRFPEFHRFNAGIFVRILDEAHAQGELGPASPEEAGLHFIGAMHMMLVKRLREPDYTLDRAAAERLVDRYIQGVGIKAGEETSR